MPETPPGNSSIGRTRAVKLLGDLLGAQRRAYQRIPESVLEAAWLFVTLRVLLSVFGIAVWASAILPVPCTGDPDFSTWSRFPLLNSQDTGFVLLGQWQRYDACWYLKIATFGYEAGAHDVAFFPLFPLLVSLVGWLTLGNLALAAMAVAGIGYILAVVGVVRLIGTDIDPDVARRAALYLSVFPAAFFLFAPFSESLFLALGVWAIYLARQARWGWTAVVGLLAALTRTQGVFLAIAISWEVIRWWRARSRRATVESAQSLAGRLWAVLPSVVGAAAALAPVVGFVAFVAFAAIATGETPMDAQRHWNVEQLRAPWEVLRASFEYVAAERDLVQAANLGSLVLAVGLVVAGASRLPLSYTLYALPQLALILTRLQPVPLMSTTRYLLVIFPLFVVLALVGQRRRFHIAWLIGSVLFLGYLTYLFLIGRFVG